MVLQFGPAFFDFSLVVGLFGQDLFLGLYQGFPLFALGAFDGLIEDALGLFLCADDFLFRYLFAVQDAQGNPYDKRDEKCDHAS